MKFLPLVWKGAWYNVRRTVLTLATVGVAFLLFGLLHGVDRGVSALVNTFSDRLMTGARYGGGLPISYLDKIRAVPGVAAVTHLTGFAGYYGEPRNTLPVFATDQAVFDVYRRDFRVPPEQVQAMARTRTAAIASSALAERYRWQKGESFVLGSAVWTRNTGSRNYEFELAGLIPVSSQNGNQMLARILFVNYDYLDEARMTGKGRVNFFVTRVSDVSRAAEVSRTIDALFANSADETRTSPENAMLQNQLRQAVDLGLIVNLIMSAVFVTLLFVTANTMAQSVRERTSEFATLMTLGFSPGTVSTIVILEVLTICLIGAVAGLTLAALLFTALGSFFGLTMPLIVIAEGLGIALILALITGLAPALRTYRVDLVNALAGR